VPFTLRNIMEDLEDIGSVFDGPPDLEFRAATKPLELLVIGAPNLGEDPRGDVDGRRDWWSD
jgi:hypothetical protein